MSLREEFRLKKLGFSDVRPERFCVLMWRSPGLVYVLYRIIVAVYTIVWLAITAEHYEGGSNELLPWGVYLTNWTYTLLTIYFSVHAVVAVLRYTLCQTGGMSCGTNLRAEEHKHLFCERTADGYQEIMPEDEVLGDMTVHSDRLPIYFIVVWILFSTVSVGALMVSLVFWAILVPGEESLGSLDVYNLQLHLVNSILILLEHSLTAIPVRLLHVVYPIIYGIIYAFFSLMYWVDDHDHKIYPILDWNKAGETIGYVCLVGFVIIPVLHLLLYGLYRFKMFLFWKCVP